LPRRRVIVVSHSNHRNFGDRLGYHVVNEVIPADCAVVHHHFRPFTARPNENCDLLIVGTGHSLFQPFLTDDLMRLVEKAPRVVGIFGTQFRDAIDRNRLDVILDKADAWFARHAIDLELFAGERTNGMLLGDWLISTFPMAEWTNPKRLVLGRIGHKVGGVWFHRPLDRIIQRIQSYREVFSPRVHPLLCALTSAERVAYSEQRSRDGSGMITGKFGSMLQDIFGRVYPENEFFDVDREAVAAYKLKVQQGMRVVRERLAEILA
jgi:hypothetical protein